jgi:putative SOS response-associated peptidase YedK
MATGAEEIVDFFNLDSNSDAPSLPLNWNVAPTNEIYIIKEKGQPRPELATASWGMIAPWQKNLLDARASQSHAINARSESIHEKPTFRDAFRRTRCLIPVTGYYEWATALGDYPPKQPFYITNESGTPLSIAGIWSSWTSETGEVIESASIITREAVSKLSEIHSRMPVMMSSEKWGDWLDSSNRDIESLRSLMVSPDPAAGLIARPVSPRVNIVANNGATLIEEIVLGAPETLF